MQGLITFPRPSTFLCVHYAPEPFQPNARTPHPAPVEDLDKFLCLWSEREIRRGGQMIAAVIQVDWQPITFCFIRRDCKFFW